MNAKMHRSGFILLEQKADVNESVKELEKVKNLKLDSPEKKITNSILLVAEVSHLQVDRYWNFLLLRNEENEEVRIENLSDVTIL